MAVLININNVLHRHEVNHAPLMIVHQTGVYLLTVIEQQQIIYRYTLMEIHIWSESENDSQDLSDMSKLTSVIDINYFEPKINQPCQVVNSIDTALFLLYDIRTVLIILV